MCESPGTMCAFRATLGKFGFSISHSCVDTNFFPSGWLMLIGLFARLMFIAGAPGWRKCPVDPASAIPISLLICMGLVALLANSLFSVLLLAATVLSSLSIKLHSYLSAAPPFHA